MNARFSLKSLLVAVFALITLFQAVGQAKEGSDPLRYLPVQDAGRIKPLDTLARETLQLVYGSETYKAPSGERHPAIEIVMTWMLLPNYWDTQKIVQITHRGLKESLNLPVEEKYFTPQELFANPRTSLVIQELNSFRATKQKLTPYFQAVQRLESQLGMYQSIKQGLGIRVVPPRASGEAPVASEGHPGDSERWISVAELQGEFQNKFGTIIKALIHNLPSGTVEAPPEIEIANDEDGPSLTQAVEEFKALARAENPALYPTDRVIAVEVHERSFHPFMYTWILYLIGAVTLAFAWHFSGSTIGLNFYRAGWVLAVLAFLLHTYGFALRIYLTGRAPVSNMYESVVWVSWGTVLFASIFEALYRRRFVLLAGTLVGVLCLLIADMAPTILDRSLQPLEPVLRSNFWLTTHVLTITLSYSAFFLAWGLGNIGLGFVLFGERATSDRMRLIVQTVYRALQIGVVLLAAGTILGGIWADYSWGRFWGWDPKETWAFIALMGYIALLHGRLIGWVRNIGMLAGSVIAFSLVIMAWYGVNYVLGAGLHSYGFGAGGVQYVAGFVILNFIYLAYVLYIHYARSKKAA